MDGPWVVGIKDSLNQSHGTKSFGDLLPWRLIGGPRVRMRAGNGKGC